MLYSPPKYIAINSYLFYEQMKYLLQILPDELGGKVANKLNQKLFSKVRVWVWIQMGYTCGEEQHMPLLINSWILSYSLIILSESNPQLFLFKKIYDPLDRAAFAAVVSVSRFSIEFFCDQSLSVLLAWYILFIINLSGFLIYSCFQNCIFWAFQPCPLLQNTTILLIVCILWWLAR